VPAGEDLWRLLLVITLNKIRKKGTYYATAKRQGALAFGTQDFERYLDSKEAGESAFQFLQLVVREAMESLPPLHLAIMELRLQGYEVAEIAAKTERSKRTVERVLQEFRKKLDGILRQDS
jgi:RNA polymerase sigma-70 factor (ECF subfamily)